MTNKEIASHLREIAVYKEISGDNPFKVRAFDQAARAVEGCPDDAVSLASEGRLTRIKGVGKGIEEVILEFMAEGHSRELEQLKSAYPPTLTDLLAVPGVGPKKVKALWEKLGISTLGELEYACRENRLVTLDGFGKKTQDKILKGIAFRKRYSEMHLYSEALEGAREAVRVLEATGRFEKASIAGSLRRGKTHFKDVDVVLVPARGAAGGDVTAAVTALADRGEGGDGLIGAGETKVSVRRGGLQMDFRIVPSESYPFALQHFTGSKEHNTVLRARARKMGLKMNEYGIFRNGRPLPAANEEEVYGLLGLPFIPPEIREGEREVEAAEEGALPRLVEKGDLKGMIHVHSNYSDGLESIEQLAGSLLARGFSYLCLSDHSRSASYAGGLTEEAVRVQREEVARLNGTLAPFRIFHGIESDILSDGRLDYPDEVLALFDFIIGSVHSRLAMPPEEATERLVRAVENPALTILGHISGRLLLSREGYPYDEGRVLDALMKNGVALEHNCNPHRLDPDWPVLKKAAERGIPIALSPDAHSSEGFDDIAFGLTMARKAWCEKRHILNCCSAGEIDERFKRRKKEKGL
jgi:DNA polymerase (family 10)